LKHRRDSIRHDLLRFLKKVEWKEIHDSFFQQVLRVMGFIAINRHLARIVDRPIHECGKFVGLQAIVEID
jgi:hypothetical protein